MKYYLSGKITGVAGENRDAFAAAAGALRANGHDVVNPHDVNDGVPNRSWSSDMRRCLVAMLACDAVATLPDWHNSRGAMLEVTVARACGLAVHRAPTAPDAAWSRQ